MNLGGDSYPKSTKLSDRVCKVGHDFSPIIPTSGKLSQGTRLAVSTKMFAAALLTSVKCPSGWVKDTYDVNCTRSGMTVQTRRSLCNYSRAVVGAGEGAGVTRGDQSDI